MRRVLVDHAKSRLAAKRGGGAVKVALEDVAVLPGTEGFLNDIVDLDRALQELAALDPRKVQIVEMKFFAGMTNLEVAHALAISDATVERDWSMARAWLIRALSASHAKD